MAGCEQRSGKQFVRTSPENWQMADEATCSVQEAAMKAFGELGLLGVIERGVEIAAALLFVGLMYVVVTA
jgi:hypothetical protein